jgi:hypothetical protein
MSSVITPLTRGSLVESPSPDVAVALGDRVALRITADSVIVEEIPPEAEPEA